MDLSLAKRGPGRPRKVLVERTEPVSLAEDPLLSASQAEKLCGLSSKTLRRAIGKGELQPAGRLLPRPGESPNPNSKYMIRRSELERWVKTRIA